MSKESKKFKVPDLLANLYDFANSLDVRRFKHYGVQQPQSDGLVGPRALEAWMSHRGLLFTSAKVTPALFETALHLRACVRDDLRCDPADPGKDRDASRSLRRHANGLTARPLIALSGGSPIVAIGTAWPLILAICIGIEERAVARLLDHRLRQHRRCVQNRQNGHRAEKFRRRHCVSPMQVMGSR